MMQEVGCTWNRRLFMYLSKRLGVPVQPPSSIFFPEGFLTFIDESHISIPQIGECMQKVTGLMGKTSSRMDSDSLPPLRTDRFGLRNSRRKWTKPSSFRQLRPSTKRLTRKIPWSRLSDRQDFLIWVLEDMEYVADSLMTHIQTAIKHERTILNYHHHKKSSEELAEYLASNWIKSIPALKKSKPSND